MHPATVMRQKIDELRPRFLATLAVRLDRFEQLRHNLRTTDDPATLLAEVRFGTHQIAGLALTFGFSDLGTLAQTVEMMIQDMTETQSARLHAPVHHSPELIDALDDLLGEMALLVG